MSPYQSKNGEHNVRMIQAEPDNCLWLNEEERQEDNDLYFAYINVGWGKNAHNDTWYIEEIDHLIRSGHSFKCSHLDQG